MQTSNVFFRIGLNTAVQIAGKALSLFLGLGTTALLTRYLGTGGYGNYTLVFAYLSFFSTIADFGLQFTVVQELTKKEIQQQTIYSTFLSIKLFLVIASVVLALIFLLFFPYPSVIKTAIIVGAISVAFGNLMGYATTIFQSFVRLDLVTILDIVAKIVTVIGIIMFIHMNLGLYALITAVGIGNLAGLCAAAIILRQKISVSFHVNTILAKQILKASIPIGFAAFISLLYFKVDTVMLSLYKSASDVGVYSFSYKIFENTLTLWSFYIASLYPLLSKFYHKKEKTLFSTVLQRSYLLASGGGIVCILILFLLAPFLVELFGGTHFHASILPLRILSLSIPLFFLDNIFYSLFLILHRVKNILFIMCLALLSNILLNLFFIPRFGFIGASITTVLTEGAVLGGYVIIFIQSKKNSFV